MLTKSDIVIAQNRFNAIIDDAPTELKRKTIEVLINHARELDRQLASAAAKIAREKASMQRARDEVRRINVTNWATVNLQEGMIVKVRGSRNKNLKKVFSIRTFRDGTMQFDAMNVDPKTLAEKAMITTHGVDKITHLMCDINKKLVKVG